MTEGLTRAEMRTLLRTMMAGGATAAMLLRAVGISQNDIVAVTGLTQGYVSRVASWPLERETEAPGAQRVRDAINYALKPYIGRRIWT